MIARISEELLWNQIVAKAWCDRGFMQRLLSDPRAVLAEHNLEVPHGTEVEVLLGTEVRFEDTEMVQRYILTASPPHEFLEEDLVGGAVAYCGCGACGRCGACGCRC